MYKQVFMFSLGGKTDFPIKHIKSAASQQSTRQQLHKLYRTHANTATIHPQTTMSEQHSIPKSYQPTVNTNTLQSM